MHDVRPPKEEEVVVTSELLTVRGLRVTYGGVVAVDGFDLDVAEGRVVGLIGPNGAGKTSAIDALTGYHAPSGGTVTLDGRDITKVTRAQAPRRGLARTFQSVELFDDLTVEENLLVAAETVTIGGVLRDLFLPARPPDRDAIDWALGRLRPGRRRAPLPDRALPRPAQARRRRPRAGAAAAARADGRARRRPRHRRDARARPPPARAARTTASRSCSSTTTWASCSASATTSTCSTSAS